MQKGSIVYFVIFLTFILLISCSPKGSTEKENTSGLIKAGDQMLCPVDGSKMTVNQNTRFFTYNGKKYFVCCLECLNTVEKNPGKYLR